MKIVVAPRAGKASKRFPITVELSPTASVKDLKLAVQKQSKLDFYRQRIITGDKKALTDDDATLASLSIQEGDSLEIKDLGPQISWRTVFLVEYFGPLFIHPFFYYAQSLVYRKEFEHSQMQTLAFYLILLHFAKREMETLFVHRFSSATMPAFNIFKNSAHYWGLSGLVLAVPLYGPWYSADKMAGSIRNDPTFLYSCAAVWIFAQVSNFANHLKLKNLRPAGTKARGIPTGYGFNLVSCSNYTFEILGWLTITVMTLDPAALLFTIVSAGQMCVWAVKKHKRYRKEFGSDYPRNRKAIIPFIF